jgi:acyl-CoA synthetase (AMP-forming)/AMP-acid ligase II
MPPRVPWETIPEMVLSTADRFGDAEAVVEGDLRLTFGELADRVLRAAGAFAGAGVAKGDRVAIWAPNSAEWIVAAFGLLTAGAVLVPVNTRFKQAEASDIVRRSGARLVLVQEGFLGLNFTTGLTDVPVIDIKSGFLASGAPFERIGGAGKISPDDIADIIFTSGTTGRPKGVMMPHTATLRLYAEWNDLAGTREGDRYLIVNPFFHIFGYKAGVIASMIRGMTVYPFPVFDVERVLAVVEKEKITVLPGAPTIYHELLAARRRGGHDLSSLRVAVTGAADIPVDLIRRISDELPFQSIMTGYGLTEAGTITASRQGDSFEDIATTVGLPCDGFELRIAADGEVLARGFAVMKGYLDDPVATAEAIDADGWLHTGDLGAMDPNGRLKIIGRKKDMFIVGGFNAYPAEIEGFLMQHPAVAQAAVIGVPDERMGQVGQAFVVLAAGESVSPDELIAWARQRMAGFKVPRSVTFIDALPLNATGKVQKDLLRQNGPARPPTARGWPGAGSPRAIRERAGLLAAAGRLRRVEDADQAVVVPVRAGAEYHRRRSAERRVTDLQPPQAVDRDRPAVRGGEPAEVPPGHRVEHVDPAVSEVAHEQVTAERPEPGGRDRQPPRLVQRAAAGDPADELAVDRVHVDEAAADPGDHVGPGPVLLAVGDVQHAVEVLHVERGITARDPRVTELPRRPDELEVAVEHVDPGVGHVRREQLRAGRGRGGQGQSLEHRPRRGRACGPARRAVLDDEGGAAVPRRDLAG